MSARNTAVAARPTPPDPQTIGAAHTRPDDPLIDTTDPVGAAREYVARSALAPGTDGSVRRIGLELEFHLVDLTHPGRRPTWARIQSLLADLPAMPSGSSVTVEPGGQLELSTPPRPGVAASVAALRADRSVLRAALATAGYGTAPLGTDPARPARRVNPSQRYVAMEQHFAAAGCAAAGASMMTGTAALQVNLDAGPAASWAARVEHLHRVGPVLVAMSACSPLLAGRASGWASMRQQAWHGIDRRRTAAFTGADPAAAWADYALRAPVMLVHDDAGSTPVTEHVPFEAWLRGHAPFGRRPRLPDLGYHLTTLFPPVRPRGYLELRYLDAVPDRWWPALAAITVALTDGDATADRVRELCEPVQDQWVTAARDGLADAGVHAAARGCLDLAVEHCDPELRPDVVAYAELVAAGRSPGDEIRERVAGADPLTVLREEARA